MNHVGENAFSNVGTKGIYVSQNKMLLPSGAVQKNGLVFTVGDIIALDTKNIFSIDKIYDSDNEDLFLGTSLNTKSQKIVKEINHSVRVPKVGEKISTKISFYRNFTVGEVLYSYRKNGNILSILVISDKKDCWFDCLENYYWFEE